MASAGNTDKLGVAQAALLAAMLGPLALALTHLGSEISAGFKTLVHNLGRLWMPGADGIGPYSGKETVSLLVWLASWAVLHRILKAREWNQTAVLTVFLLGIALATTLLWPPVTHWAAHFFTGA